MERNLSAFKRGMRDGIPIATGYFVVAFTLGIAAKNAGFSAIQAFVISLTNNASAGEYAVFTLVAAGASYLEVAIMTLVANARYLLMSCALSQKLSPKTSLVHRLLIGFYVTDEIFAVSVSGKDFLNPFYTYGVISVAAPGWALGTLLGVILGSVLPLRLVSALGVGLFGMFLAIIIPPARKSRVVAGVVLLSFAASGLSSVLPAVSSVPEGTRIIVLTVLISAGAALLFPVPPSRGEKKEGCTP